MTELGTVLKQLKHERVRAKRELRKLDQAIKVFAKLAGRKAKKARKAVKRGRHKLSLAARKKIAAAQKARWAKVRGRLGKKAA